MIKFAINIHPLYFGISHPIALRLRPSIQVAGTLPPPKKEKKVAIEFYCIVAIEFYYIGASTLVSALVYCKLH